MKCWCVNRESGEKEDEVDFVIEMRRQASEGVRDC